MLTRPQIRRVRRRGLQRRLGLGDAVIVGAGSMVGAGVFTVWGPAAHWPARAC